MARLAHASESVPLTAANALRVVMLAYYFPPYLSAGASRAGQLAKYLARAGADVHVVTAHVHDLPLKSDVHPGDVSVVYAKNFEINAIPARILRRDLREHGYGLSPGHPTRLLGSLYQQVVNFPDAQVGWIPGAISEAERLLQPSRSVVVSSSPPASAHIAGAVLAARHQVPWVAEFRDPWIDNPYFRRWWPARTVERQLHDVVMRRASAVVSVSRGFSTVYEERLHRAIHHVPNGYDPEDFVGPPPSTLLGQIAHAGTVYAAYDTRLLLEGMRLARREVHALFSGRNIRDLRERADDLGVLDRVQLLGPVLRSEAILQMRRSEANILFFTRKDHPYASHFVPQKLYEYLGAGRPVLAIGDGDREAGDILRSSGLGLFVDTPQAVARAIEVEISASPDRSAIQHFAYPAIAAQYLRILHDVTR